MKNFFLSTVILWLFLSATFASPNSDGTDIFSKTDKVNKSALSVPFNCPFATQSEFDQWTVIDVNKDKFTWKWDGGLKEAKYSFSSSNNANDWIISPAIILEAGKKYRLSFEARSNAASYPEKMKVYMGKGNTVEAQENLLGDYQALEPDFNKKYIIIKPTETGEYNIGFYACSNKNMSYLHLRNIVIEYATIPDVVSEFTLTPGANGVKTATISFKTPTLTAGGDALESIDKIEIYRGTTLVKTFNNPAVGVTLNYVDNVEISGIYEYKIIASNDSGSGSAVVKTDFIGEDIAKAPTNIVLVKEGNNAILTWEAPVVSVNGGWINSASMTYKITRMPDNVVVSESVSALTYTDPNLTIYDNYSYKVQVKTTAGFGQEATSNAVKIGNPLNIPYVCKFDTENEFNKWTVINNNGDNSTWQYDKSGKLAKCSYNAQNDSDDWLLSPPLVLKSGDVYRVTFDIKAGTVTYNENLKVYYGQGSEIENFQNNLLADYQNVNSTALTKKSVIIKPGANGEYSVGFYAYSPKNRNAISVTNISVEKIADNDMAALSIIGSITPMINKEYIYSVEVQNKGANTKTGYKVQMIGEDNTILSETTVNESLLTEQTKIVNLKYTPKTVGMISVKGKVISENDQLSTNDETLPLNLNIKSASNEENVSIVYSNAKEDKTLPINFYYKSTAAQTIYTADEIAIGGGLIKKITYPYNNKNAGSSIKPIKIYMCSTEREDLSEGWIPESELTLVYDANVELKAGVNTLEIELATPFVHMGGNLCIMAIRPLDVSYVNNIMFYLGDVYQSRSIRYQSDTQEFDFETSASVKLSNVPNINLIFENIAGSSIKGKVTTGGVAVEGAEVVIQPYNMRAITDNLGQYEFKWAPVGTFTLTINKYGYQTYEQTGINVTADQVCVLNSEMVERPSFNIEGMVSDMAGKRLEGAVVSLKGYKNYVASTDNKGVFTIANVYKADGYEVKVTKYGYSSNTSTVDISEDNLILPVIMLSDIPNAPIEVVANATISKVDLSWQKPSDKKLYRYDDGKLTGKLGFTSGTAGNGAMGAVHRIPSVLNSMSWYTLGAPEAGGPHATVNVFVFDLDASGAPTKNVIFKQFQVPNIDDQWSSFTFPEPVKCPNGFMIAIGYEGFVGIGLDSGVDTQWPFILDGNYRIGNYMTGEFIVNSAAENIAANYMIRAIGNEMNEVVADGSKSVTGYKIWRLIEADQDNEANWTLLTPTPVTSMTYVDESWAEIGSGVYKYAVKAVYPNGILSSPTFSNEISRDMNTEVTITVTTNTPVNDSEGAKVILTNKDNKPDHIYNGTIDSDGKVTLNNVWKGIYKITVTHKGYTSAEQTEDLTAESTYNFAYNINEIVEEPFNLKVIENEYPFERILVWNGDDAINENFENHTDFRINSPGDLKWSYIDADGGTTQSFTGISFPNAGEPMAYIIFNPSQTTPAMTPTTAPSIQPHSGSKFLATFASVVKPNRDYFISPELNFSKDFTFSFWAKSQTIAYGKERFKVGYSVNSNEEQDFTNWLTNDPYIEVPEAWTKYTYTVPAAAKYVTIECVSNDAFIFMIDDIFLGTRPEASKVLQKYEVYLDGEKNGDAVENTYTLTNLTVGKHIAGIKAVYATTTTDMISVEFNVTGTSVAAAVKGEVKGINNENLSGVKATISGIRTYETVTDENGQFQFPAVLAGEKYKIVFSKEGFGNQVRTFNVIAGQDLILGTVIMGEETYTPKKVTAKINEADVDIKWIDGTMPVEDIFRYDDGTATNGLGSTTGTDKTVVGNVYKKPAKLTKIMWQTVGSATKVNVFIFDITAEGQPTSTVLYKKTNVNNVVNTWNELTLENQVECPNGFYIAISISAPATGNVALGVDSGLSEQWPFVPNAGYFAGNYTTGTFQYTGSMFTKNLMIRAEGFPINSKNATKKDKNRNNLSAIDYNAVAFECINMNLVNVEKQNPANTENITRALTGYKVWRLKNTDTNIENNWELLTAEPVSEMAFTDTNWKTVTAGKYIYAVKAIYTGGVISEPGFSDEVEKLIESQVTINIKATGTDIAVKNAVIKLTNNDGINTHIYNGKTNTSGTAILSKVYKGIYKVEITIDGYQSLVKTDVDLSIKNEYVLDYTLDEIIGQPINLKVSETEIQTERILTWSVDNELAVVRNVEIYLDNNKVGETKSDTYTFKGLENGNHTAGVKLLYQSTTSELRTISFEVVGINDLSSSSVNIYPNPFTDIINIDGDFEYVEIYDSTGKIVLKSDSSSKLDVSKLLQGSYIIKIYQNQEATTVKMIK